MAVNHGFVDGFPGCVQATMVMMTIHAIIAMLRMWCRQTWSSTETRMNLVTNTMMVHTTWLDERVDLWVLMVA